MHLHVFSSPEDCRPGFLKAFVSSSMRTRSGANGLISFLVAGMLLLLAGCGAGMMVAPQSASGGAATLQISPGTLNFGDVAVGQTAKSTVTVANSGTQPIVVAQIDVPSSVFSNASGQSFPMTIPGGSTRTLQMGFSPSAATNYSGQITLLDGNKKAIGQVPAQGRGMSNAPVATLSPQLTLSTSQVNFGSVTVNGSSTQTVTLSSTGTSPVTVNAVIVSGTGFVVSGTNLPFTLNPNQTALVEIRFNPATAGSVTGQVTIQSDSTNGAAANVGLSGAGTTAPTPQLNVSVGALSFGSVVANSSSSQSVTLTSNGTAPVTISSVAVSGAVFSVSNSGLPTTLQPGQSLVLPVLFAPSSVGIASGQLTIFSDSSAGGATMVSLSGMSTAVPVPQLTVSSGNLNFGSVTVNSSSTQTLTLTSTGTAPVTVSSMAGTGAGFSVAGIALPITLSPGQSMMAQVKFSPATVGTSNGQLTVVSDSSGGAAVVGLLGTSTAAPVARLSASLTALSFGSTTVNTSSTQSLTLTSSGTAAVTVSSVSAMGSGFLVVGTVLPVTLAPGQSITVQAKFSPSTAGAATGQLTVGSDSADGVIVLGLNGTGTAAPVAKLTASVGALSFGSTTVSTSSTHTVTLTSSGTAAVTVNSISATGAGFSIAGGGSATLQPGQSMTVQVKFSPSATGAVSGQLNVGSDSLGGIIVITLSGTGTPAPSPLLSAGVGSLGFGTTTVNTSTSQPLTVMSTGTAPVTVNSVFATGTGFSVVGAVLPATLQPGQSMTVMVRFSPSATGPASGQLTIGSDSSNGNLVIALVGSGTPAPSPQLAVSAGSMSFGSMTVNTSATQTLTLSSTGTANVTVNSIAAAGSGFSVMGAVLPVSLAPGQSMTVQIKFSPTTVGLASGQLTIGSDSAGGSIVVALSGTSTAQPNPQLTVSAGSLSFGSIAVNASSVQTITLSSTGNAPVTVNSVMIAGTGFSVVAQSFPVTLNPSQSLTVQIQFSPAAAGSASGQMTINSNSTSGTIVVGLSGAGTAPNPQMTITPGSLSFGNVNVGTATTQSVTLMSTGTSSLTVSAASISGAGYALIGGAFPVTLNPGQSMTVNIQFLPTVAGDQTGKLTISSNATGGSTSMVSLSGSGTAVSHQVDLGWSAPTNSPVPIAGFNIYRAGSSGSFSVISLVTSSTLSYSDKSVTSGANYQYMVKAIDASGLESDPSNQIALAIP